MKTIPALVSLAAVALIGAQPVLANPQPATTAPTTPATRYTLDTPIETLVADTRAKAVLDADLPSLTSNPKYETFKGMSLTVLASFAPDKLTPDRLDKVRADLAKID
jgi:hypothetical protein